MPHSLPAAFIEQMRSLLGDELQAFLQALDSAPPTSLRLNARKPGAAFPQGSPIPWAPQGRYLPQRPVFFKDPLIYAGAYYVQEASSMLIAQAVDWTRDLHILDLCAAPGGKSTLLASQMSPGSFLVSNELVRNRAVILDENLSRWGNPAVLVTHNHPRDFADLHQAFDLIVVDAPCSGEGMFRKDPKTIDLWSPKLTRDCAERQREILGQVLPALAPGGRLIYSTCTYNSLENEAIVRWMLDHYPGLKLVNLNLPREWGLAGGRTSEFGDDLAHCYHCYPHRLQGEGFFLACLERTGGAPAPSRAPKIAKRPHQRQQASLQPATRKQREILGEWMDQPDEFAYYLLDDTACAVPAPQAEAMAQLAQQLNPMKLGIRMGEFKRDQLVPDHDLAMSERQGVDIPTAELDLEQALRLLKRTELRQDHPGWMGWGIVRYQGRNLGWIKALQGRINNHFPKEMRIRSDVGLED